MKRTKKYFVQLDERERCFEVETLEPGRYRVVTPDGDELIFDAAMPEDDRLHLLSLSSHYSIDASVYALDATRYGVQIGAYSDVVSVLNERQKRQSLAGVGGEKLGGPELLSPMAGKVVAVMADAGESVVKGQTVVVIEAMKMENDLKAHKDGEVREILVQAGHTVEIGDLLLSID